ncbi:hypothetical protein [Actinokineospora terrae]|uniref:BioF2-like acetyltransferase domain-containing protein n=1 Tax=Actinokineospora terrae TaxID=155974 RepID=A0A1H9K9S6_9PSEU|nr:hypothetical protein [Actinokineospora terrae]SEQ95615.1 hypothetical protein SAMN04487818_10174 [Actinokineospora terrae]
MHGDLVDPLTEVVDPGWDRFAADQGACVLWHADPLTTAAWAGQTATVMAVVRDGTDVAALFHARLHGPQDYRRFHRSGSVPPVGFVECRLSPASLAGHLFATGLDASGRRAAVEAFERAVRSRYRVAGFCYRHVESGDVPAVDRGSRRVLAVSPDTVLTAEWSNVDGYLAQLPPKWRSQLRKIRATVRSAPGVRRALVDQVPPPDAARLVNLVRFKHQRRGVVRTPIPEHYFEHLNADPGTRFSTYRDDRGLLALSTVHDNGTDLTMSYWGIRDRVDGGLPNLYFDHYVDLVEHTIGLGRATLRPGKGMARIKERFGARPVANHLVVGW